MDIGMTVDVRALEPGDLELVRNYLFLAIYVPEGEVPPPRSVLEHPDIARYVEGWGRAGDLGLVAWEPGTGLDVGAAWLRLWRRDDPGYGFVDEDTPELSMAVRPDRRGKGIGTRLLSDLLRLADAEYDAVSLSVSDGNPAKRLYERTGFVAVSASGDSTTMVRYRRA